VHKFSKDSMPVSRALLNFGHYWLLFGGAVGFELFFRQPKHSYSKTVLGALTLLWGACQLLNLACHKHLASFRLRPAKADSAEEY
jgi:hypothetical protein